MADAARLEIDRRLNDDRPMTRDEVLAKLRRHADALRRMGVAHLYLFGSTARNEAGAGSDVDLFFDYDLPGFSLIELVAVRDRVSEWLGAPADVTTRASLHPRIRPAVEGSALQVF